MEPLHLLCLPDELIIEILSWLPVKSLLQFRVVSKTWKSFISDPQFVKLHLLHRLSFRNADFEHTSLLIKCHTDDFGRPYISSRTVSSLLESPSAIVASRSCISGYDFIGTCNGLVSLRKLNYDESNTNNFSQVRFWNPATRTMSQDSPPSWSPRNLHLGFGYDCSSDTYKVVGMIPGLTMVNVYNMGDNCWRTIQISPHAPMHLQGSAVYVHHLTCFLHQVNMMQPSYV
ncbi:F-box/kelch-repeat protein At3g23880-like isoform X1 [Lotus japonicus]|uniref:F-box/kelch-repeat protein At3g23880-like isoform X1 n=1 Tax=Lotus japonicus TaxID=34305 RepID=UPI0025901159|nr:F-box/kelch-repeat protein At3g23880-like isoform X1 [Lotus japonicus]